MNTSEWYLNEVQRILEKRGDKEEYDKCIFPLLGIGIGELSESHRKAFSGLTEFCKYFTEKALLYGITEEEMSVNAVMDRDKHPKFFFLLMKTAFRCSELQQSRDSKTKFTGVFEQLGLEKIKEIFEQVEKDYL